VSARPDPAAASTSAPAARPRRRRGRLVFWSALAVLVVFAVFLAFLATVGSTKANSRLLGKPAPAVRGRLLAGGRSITLTDFTGRWVLVNFAASWCIPCQQEMPELQQFAQSGAKYHATILTVTDDPNDSSGLRSMLAGDHATWPAVADAGAQVQWGVTGIPESFLVDPSGVVVAYFPSGVDATTLDSIISPLSTTAPAPASS
jgi:cytochrome c biogenesis protein CcmG/thiol:disulfide interchange protein DsbE